MNPTKFHKIKDVRQMLLISLTCIGDALLTTPVAKVMKDHYPDAKLTVLSGPTAHPLLAPHALVDRAFVFENRGKHSGAIGMLRLINMLRTTHYDLVVDLRNSAIPYFLRARHIITAHKAHLENREARGRHAIDRHLDVLESNGFAITCRSMQLTVPPHATESVNRIMEEMGQDPAEKLIGIYPGAGSPYKEYPPEKYAAVLRTLADIAPGSRFAVVGGPADVPAAAKVASALPDITADYSGKLNILETAALIKKCGVFISNDSGPMHIATALEVPTVAVFGPTDARRYGPRGNIHRIVWHREECNPCKAPTCGHESCINLVREPEIVRAAADILGLDFAPETNGESQLTLNEEKEKQLPLFTDDADI